MALKPADDPEQRGQPEPMPDRRSGSQSTLMSGLGRLRGFFRRLGDRLTRPFRSSTDDGDASTETAAVRRRRRMLEAPGSLGSDADPPELTDCPSVDGLPPRERPLTVPARDESWDNQPDLTVEETSDGLTLSMPEEPEATITSNVWEPIEP